jgi:hypothetical protein
MACRRSPDGVISVRVEEKAEKRTFLGNFVGVWIW